MCTYSATEHGYFFPHTRGDPSVQQAHRLVLFSRTRGVIPSCAGDAASYRFPRTRGGDPTRALTGTGSLTFPAHAGVIPGGSFAVNRRALFRIRGGDPMQGKPQSGHPAFPAYARVILSRRTALAYSILFPAYAPFPRIRGGDPSQVQAVALSGAVSFPRIRGGDPCLAGQLLHIASFSPHTRGDPCLAGQLLHIASFSRIRGVIPK